MDVPSMYIDVDDPRISGRQKVLLRISYEATSRTIERRACTQHSLALMERALNRSTSNLRRSMEVLLTEAGDGDLVHRSEVGGRRVKVRGRAMERSRLRPDLPGSRA
jgi:hypothetical protein